MAGGLRRWWKAALIISFDIPWKYLKYLTAELCLSRRRKTRSSHLLHPCLPPILKEGTRVIQADKDDKMKDLHRIT